ncbi:10389_t:CDS:2 [Acaulospora morrowiae]|uniref:10389_t:CDS:1 n=1 Tax=Acaulospora morrowiae TaxID=94023 RepID=A0A9N9FF16_9GLOM|nr:10389_t:CDS:2 [Acaulospora morrowiae]
MTRSRNNSRKGDFGSHQIYKLPKLPDRSLTTSNYGAAPIMQRGNHNNIHQRCGDFIIDIEPYSHRPSTSSGGVVSSGSVGGTVTMTTAHSTVASISEGQSVSMETTKKLRDLESHVHYQSEQIKSLFWERDDLKYRNHNLEAQVKMMLEKSNNYDKLLKECEGLKAQNGSLLNGVQQLKAAVAQSNKERDDVRGSHQLMEFYLNQLQEKLNGHEKLVLELNAAKNQLKDMDVENKSLREEAVRLRKQNDNLAAGMGRFQDEINFFIKQRDDLSAENSNLISKSDLMLSEADKLHLKNSELSSELDAQHKECERLREQIGELTSQNSTLASETDRLQNELDKYLNNMMRQQSDSTTSESTISEFANSEFSDEDEDCRSISTVTSTEMQHPASPQDQTDVKLQSADDFSARKTANDESNDVTYVSRDIDSDGALKKLHNQFDELTLQRDELINENGLLKSQVENLQNECNVIREQRDQTTAKNDSLTKQLEQSQSECMKISQHRDELSSQKDAIMSDHDSLITQLEQSQSECMKIRQHRDELSSQKDAIMSDHDSLITQLEQSQSECIKIRQHRDELSSQKDAIMSDHDSLITQLEHLQSECNLIGEHRDEVIGNLKAASDLNNSLTAQIDTVRKDHDELSRKMISTTSQMDQLQVKLATSVQQQENLSKEKDSLTSQLEQLRKDYDLVCQQREELSTKTHMLSSQLTQLQEELNVLNRKQFELSSQHEQSNSRCDEILKKNVALMSQLEQLQVNYDRVAKERDDFAGQVSTLSSQVTQLQGELNQNRDESINNNNTLTSQIEKLQAELDQIALNRDEVSIKNSELISQLGHVQDELNNVINQQREEVKSLTGDLTKEISRLSEHCRMLNEQNDGLQRQNHNIAAELEQLKTPSNNAQAQQREETLEVNKDILESQEGIISIQPNDESYAIIQQSDETANGNLRLREHQDSIMCERDELKNHMAIIISQNEQLRMENNNLRHQQEIGQIQEELEDFKIQRAELRNDQGRKVYEVDAPRRMNIKPQATQQYPPNQSQNSVDSQEPLDKVSRIPVYQSSNRNSIAESASPDSNTTSPMRPSTYIYAQPQQAAELNVSRSIHPEEITNSMNANQQASPPPSQPVYSPKYVSQRVRPQQLIATQPFSAPMILPEGSSSYMNESQQAYPAAAPTSYNLTPGRSQYYEDQNVPSPNVNLSHRSSIYRRYSSIGQESFNDIPSNLQTSNAYTLGPANSRYSSVSVANIDSVNRSTSVYNVSKPLPSIPSIPAQEQKPLKSSSESITSRKSIRLSGKLASLRNSKMLRSQKEIPTCQYCKQKPCKKNFTGYSRFCSPECKSMAKKDITDNASIISSHYGDPRKSYSSSIYNESVDSLAEHF